MLIYVDEIIAEISSIKEYAVIVKEKFDQGREAQELLLDARALKKRIEYLRAIMPEGCSLGNSTRHAHFMVFYLERNQVQYCQQDINDIIDQDLPAALETVGQWANELSYVDADLREEIKTLIKIGQFDSVIRKTFVILKTRVCRKYGFSEDTDGQDLANKLFGQRSSLFPEMSDAEKQAYRDLYAGIFSLVRNRFAHNDIEASLMEMDLVISAVNYCLKLIDDFRDTSSELDS